MPSLDVPYSSLYRCKRCSYMTHNRGAMMSHAHGGGRSEFDTFVIPFDNVFPYYTKQQQSPMELTLKRQRMGKQSIESYAKTALNDAFDMSEPGPWINHFFFDDDHDLRYKEMMDFVDRYDCSDPRAHFIMFISYGIGVRATNPSLRSARMLVNHHGTENLVWKRGGQIIIRKNSNVSLFEFLQDMYQLCEKVLINHPLETCDEDSTEYRNAILLRTKFSEGRKSLANMLKNQSMDTYNMFKDCTGFNHVGRMLLYEICRHM